MARGNYSIHDDNTWEKVPLGNSTPDTSFTGGNAGWQQAGFIGLRCSNY
jgi:hypothetical protein